VFFDVTPTWHIIIYDYDSLSSNDILFYANLTVYEYTGTGTKYASNKENWGTEVGGYGVPRHEEAYNDYIGTYCSYMWKLGLADLNKFYVWQSDPSYVATSARLTITVTIDYYWWNIC